MKQIIVAPSIEVNGGQNRETAGLTIEAGTNAIVAGSAIFASRDYALAPIRVNATDREWVTNG